MIRQDIINTIGGGFLTYSTHSEHNEFCYDIEFKSLGKDWDKIKIRNAYSKKESYYKSLDIRLVNEAKKLSICIETKSDYKKSKKELEKAKAQLSAYMTYEKQYSGNIVVGILANTTDNDILMYLDKVDDESIIYCDRIISMKELCDILFPAIKNSKEDVINATYKLNEILHSFGINEKVRGQFVGTCLLALKNGLEYENSKQQPREPSVVISEIKAILNNLLNRNIDDNLSKAEKMLLLDKKVLEDERIVRLSDRDFNQILSHIKNKILPYINDETKAGQDILNLFFTTFNKYVNKDDKNQAFTPDHITDFMCKITEVDYNSRVLDPCCGSGAFLVRALVTARNSCANLPNRDELIENIHKNQIFGIEESENPFGLSTTNMLIHGDGNTNIIKANCFDKKLWIQQAKPNVILMNPPYNAQQILFPSEIIDHIEHIENKQGVKKVKILKTYSTGAWSKKDGKPAKEDPTKGLCFVEYISDCLHEANITNAKLAVLLPLQCAIANSGIMLRAKENILKYNTLEAVFTLPPEMFYPGASANACCMLFTMGVPHFDINKKPNKKTFFGYFKDDGFIKKKYLGRIERLDSKNQSIWETQIQPKWLSLFKNGDIESGLSAKEYVTAEDEWLCEAYMKTNYDNLCEADFQKTLNNYLAYQITNNQKSKNTKLNISEWQEFKLEELFDIVRGDRIVHNEDYFDTQDETYKYPVITTTTANNGVDGYYEFSNCDGNCIISSGEASGLFTTYQENPCWALDTVRIYKPKGFSMNKYLGIFFATQLTYNMYLFSYGRKAKPSNMYSLSIKLPVDLDKNPDWEFIENYIKSLPYGDRI
ncbi:N-6 DNA methylase [Campylobacter mucosalis]|uniref:site-specific DNA-methyltransferase (adenine-specific) n=1 Tax=Campylobacter mucosalis CCUG 21559 TaxID=1032067 RepID=A0A6G5QFU4_9BACT|nr:N-6 DNA methylase [Campylobacter mucosalis]QCD44376.1 adenine-specific DNA methyltransferase [Campylobacter mucosalis CCUG 21559]